MGAYSREQAKMTQGFAILCMCILHLFCRTGGDVFGTPLIWINEEKPLVYWFGFFAEICIPLYTICAGYARQLTEKALFMNNLKRILKLLKNYWIVTVLFAIVGLVVGGTMPGRLDRFFRAVILLGHYNGAQWYINTYIILLLIPYSLLMFPVQKINPKVGIVCSILLQVTWYFVGRFALWPEIPNHDILSFIHTELKNLIGVLPYYWIGAFLCKGKLVDYYEKRLSEHYSKYKRDIVLFLIGLILFIGFNVLHKTVLVGVVGLSIFLIFNLFQKGTVSKTVFLFLGKHSTNIWLTHMFFYCADPFPGLVQKAKYPILMLLFMLVLCIAISYVILAIDKIMVRIQKGVFG